MKKIKLDNLAKFFDTTRQTISRWKKEEDKPVIDFTDKYLSDTLIEEFLKTSKISKFEDNKYDELTQIQDHLLSTISRKVLDYFRGIQNASIKIIFRDFLEQTKYEIPARNINDYITNVEKIRDHFYEEFTTFIYKNKDKYKVNERREAQDFMNIVLRQDEIHMYYCLCYIELIQGNEMEKFDREVDQVGLLKAIINKFFKK